jgi:transposase-like protein
MESAQMPETLDEDVLERVAQGAQRSRDDPRTGKLITSQPRAFWQAHEEQSIAQGLSIRRYCERHGLALSTLRRWSSKLAGLPRQRGSTRTKLAAVGFLPMPVHVAAAPTPAAPDAQAHVEIEAGAGVRVRVYGAQGLRVVDALIAQLGRAA